MISPTSELDGITAIVTELFDGIKSISVALSLKPFANVLSSTAPRAESDNVSQRLILSFLLLASKAVPHVEWSVRLCLNGRVVSFFS